MGFHAPILLEARAAELVFDLAQAGGLSAHPQRLARISCDSLNAELVRMLARGSLRQIPASPKTQSRLVVSRYLSRPRNLNSLKLKAVHPLGRMAIEQRTAGAAIYSTFLSHLHFKISVLKPRQIYRRLKGSRQKAHQSPLHRRDHVDLLGHHVLDFRIFLCCDGRRNIFGLRLHFRAL